MVVSVQTGAQWSRGLVSATEQPSRLSLIQALGWKTYSDSGIPIPTNLSPNYPYRPDRAESIGDRNRSGHTETGIGVSMMPIPWARTSTTALIVLMLAASLASPTPAAAAPAPIERYAGENRIETAVRVSQGTHGRSSEVVLTRSDDFADAMAAGPFVARTSRRLLLTNYDSVPPLVLAELNRLGTTYVIVAGGPAAVSETVVQQLRSTGRTVERIAGATRFQTALQFAEASGGVCRVAIADGASFADQIVAASFSVTYTDDRFCHSGALVLSSNGRLTPEVEDFVRRHQGDVYTVGDAATGAWESPVAHIGGHDQYMLSANAMRYYVDHNGDLPSRSLLVVNGDDFPDGLAAVSIMAPGESPIVLARREYLPPAPAAAIDYIWAINAYTGFGPHVLVVGGSAAIGQGTIDRLKLETESTRASFIYPANTNVGTCMSYDVYIPGYPLYHAQEPIARCTESHGYEVTGFASHSGEGMYPGRDALVAEATPVCDSRFLDYVGRPSNSSQWVSNAAPPTELMWNHGSRTSQCILYLPDGSYWSYPAQASGL